MMKKVIFGGVLKKTEVFLDSIEVSGLTAIFSRTDGVINGYINQDLEREDKGDYSWIHRVGVAQGVFGYHKTLKECLEASLRWDEYEFFIDQGGTHKKLILERPTAIIHHSEIPYNTPIFVSDGGKLIGLVVCETSNKGFNGWIVRIGGVYGAYGHHTSRESCLRAGVANTIHTYEFFIN